MARPTTHIMSDGMKNCAVKVTGFDVGAIPWMNIVETTMFKGGHARIKIDHIEWAITAGIEVFLAWDGDEVKGERELIVPLGGRGQINFADYGGLSNLAEGKTGHIELLTQVIGNPTKSLQCFSLFIDLQKQ